MEPSLYPFRMSEITTEIAGKLRLSIKKQLDSLGCKDEANDDDLLEYMMVIFGQKKRFKDICESIEPFLEGKTKKMASWLDDLIRKGLFFSSFQCFECFYSKSFTCGSRK